MVYLRLLGLLERVDGHRNLPGARRLAQLAGCNLRGSQALGFAAGRAGGRGKATRDQVGGHHPEERLVGVHVARVDVTQQR